MPAAFRRRSLAAWIGVWAMLAAALAPGLSQLLRGRVVNGWSELCSSATAHAPRTAPAAPELAGVPPAAHAYDRSGTVDRAPPPDLAEPSGLLSSAPPRARGPPAPNGFA